MFQINLYKIYFLILNNIFFYNIYIETLIGKQYILKINYPKIKEEGS